MSDIRLVPKGKETLEDMEKRIWNNMFLNWLADSSLEREKIAQCKAEEQIKENIETNDEIYF